MNGWRQKLQTTKCEGQTWRAPGPPETRSELMNGYLRRILGPSRNTTTRIYFTDRTNHASLTGAVTSAGRGKRPSADLNSRSESSDFTSHHCAVSLGILGKCLTSLQHCFWYLTVTSSLGRAWHHSMTAAISWPVQTGSERRVVQINPILYWLCCVSLLCFLQLQVWTGIYPSHLVVKEI